MKRSILALCLSFACAAMAFGQKAETRASGQGSSDTSASIGQSSNSVNLESGTRLAAQLQNTIDVRKVKVGDQVVMKTTQAIKSQGRIVVVKGARLIGHVTEVAQKSKDNGESRVGIIFDRLEQGSLAMPIAATISSITSARTSANAGNDEIFATSASGSGRATTTGSASSSGGLLGGVGGVVNSTTSTVGSAVGSTTSAVGSTVNATTDNVGNTTAGLGRTLGRVQISESSNTSVEGGSVLSLQGDNLRLEKGTNFNLVLTQSASAGTARDQ
ncbi:MAG TPA: hypothetical protein VEW46_25605 [Pyrinomonadaceae bacterium]|nr:hypothetical protein [Pyrinomonadaceae bacterium]